MAKVRRLLLGARYYILNTRQFSKKSRYFAYYLI